MTRILVIRPDGQTLAMDMDSASGAAGHFCGGMVIRLPEAFHALQHYEVWHLDDWAGQPVNRAAGNIIGLPLAYEPLRGTVVLTRLPDGQDTRAEREHQRQYFGMLDAVDAGFCTADEAGIDYLIRVNSNEGDHAA